MKVKFPLFVSRQFQRLQWRLAISYLLTSVIVLCLLELLVTLIGITTTVSGDRGKLEQQTRLLARSARPAFPSQGDVRQQWQALWELHQANDPAFEGYLVAIDGQGRVLMDLVMPGMDGVEAIRRLKQVSPHSQVVALTSFHDDTHIFPALRAGALSYILKDIPPDGLVEVVRKAARGESVLHPQVAARVVQELRGTRHAPPNPFVELSERELQVLRLIAGGLSNAKIAARLTISEKTVKGHLSNILSKLHLMDRTQAAVFAWQQGLIQRE